MVNVTMKGLSKTAYRQIWFDHVRAYQISGLSRKAYVERESLRHGQFADWVRRFNKVNTHLHTADSTQSDLTQSFIPVQIHPSSLAANLLPSIALAPSPPLVALQLSLTNGTLLSLTQLPDSVWLSDLLRALPS